MRTLRAAVACMMMGVLLLLVGSNVPSAFGEQEGSSNASAIAVGSKLIQGLDWLLTTQGRISPAGQPVSGRPDGQSGIGLVTARGDGASISLSPAQQDRQGLAASVQEDDAAASSEPCLSSSCANIAGVWKGSESGWLDCTVLGEEFSFYVNAPSQLVTITQNGCSVYYTLNGYPQYPRTGTITGDTIYVSGAMIDPGDVGYPYTISQNNISGTGTISGNYVSGHASGGVGGSVLVDGVWYSLSCTAYTYFDITRMTPVQTTLLSPSGTIATNQPTYQWQAVSKATWYQLWVNDSSGTAVNKWYSASAAGCGSGYGTCTATPDIQVGGNSQWWVLTYNNYGNGPWSDGMSFSAPSLTPGQVMPLSPSEAIDTSTPTYTWEADAAATWYLLRVVDSGGERIKKWYTAADAGCAAGAETCSATPDLFVREGKATWQVQTWNKHGYGPWSSSLDFSAPTPLKPGPVTLLSPSGSITTSLPSYTWNAAANASWYLLEVWDGRGTAIKKWYTPAAAGCDEGVGMCSVTPDTLVAGDSQWWIRPWNAVGNGDWSAGMAFKAPIPAKPGAATLVSPSGTITSSKPTYTWNPVKDATWYYLWVKDGEGKVYDKWYLASAAGCAGGIGSCAVTPDKSLAQGKAVWWLQAWNPLGTGPWTNRSFTVNAVAGSVKP